MVPRYPLLVSLARLKQAFFPRCRSTFGTTTSALAARRDADAFSVPEQPKSLFLPQCEMAFPGSGPQTSTRPREENHLSYLPSVTTASRLCNCLEKFDLAQTFICGFLSSCRHCKSSRGVNIPSKARLVKAGEGGCCGAGGCSTWLS